MRQETISAAVNAVFEQEVDFLQRLVRTKSVNVPTPDLSRATNPIEQAVAEIIHQELQHLGFQGELHGASPERPNVLCRIPGSQATEKTLILTTHMDTVEPSGYTRDPWGAQIEAGLLYGVGAADAKAQIAAMVYAIHALRLAGITPPGDVLLAFVVDEETGACSPYGTKYLLDQGLLQGDAAIIGEPGNHIISIGHRGLYRFRLTIRGEATHTGIRAWEQRKRGRNAILDMARLANALAETRLPASHSVAFPERKSVLTFPTLIQGGSTINTVPHVCEAHGDVRLVPGTSIDDLKQFIEDHLRTLFITEYRLDDLIAIPAVEVDPQTEIVQALAETVTTLTGVRPPLEGSGPACDGWMFITRGIPTVSGYGATCGGVHGADEWVDLENLRQVTDIYAHTALQYLSSDMS